MTTRSATRQAIFWQDIVSWRRRLAAPLAVLLVVATCCGWYLSTSPLASREILRLGGISSLRLSGFFSAETSAEGRGFRWTDGQGTITLDARGSGPHLLAVTLSAPRPEGPQTVPVTIAMNGTALVQVTQDGAPRRHHLLVAADQVRWRDNRLTLASPTFVPASVAGPADRRSRLGLAVFEVRWESIATPRWLAPLQALAIGLAAMLLTLLLRRAGIPLLAGLIAVFLFVAIQVAMRHSDPRFSYRITALLLTGGLAALAALAAALARPQPADGPLPWREWWRAHRAALASFVALTALMHLPLLLRFSTHIPGHPGDAFEYLWKLEIFSDYLVDRRQSPTFLPELMHPEGFELALSEITPANTLLGLPITRVFGPIVSFNSLNLLSYVLSGFFTYLLARRLGARPLAAWVAGIIFAFALRRFFQMSAGHLPLMPTQYLPLALYGLHGLLTRQRNWDAFVAAAGLALATWASLYYGTTFALFMAGYALLLIGPRRLLGFIRATWRPLTTGAVVLLALVVPFAQPYLEVRAQGMEMTHSIVHLYVHAARPGDFLLPNPYHPLWGAWAGPFQRRDGGEHIVFLGYTVILLMLMSIWALRRQRLTHTLVVLSAIAFVLALGPELRLPGGAALPLPTLFIYEHVPVLNGIRIWNRVMLYIVLAAALLTGLGLSTLAPRRRFYRAATLGAALLLIGELAAVSRFTTAEPRAVDLWLAAQPGQGAVIELPIGTPDYPLPGGSSLYYSLFYRKPSNMWYGTFNPPLYAEHVHALREFPAPDAVRALQRLETEYLIVHAPALTAIWSDWKQAVAATPELEQVYDDGYYTVFHLRQRFRPW
ncbi:MAG: hypothetical protein RMK84_03995 [Oscillochloridaceae bacterium]|nr:YfhO family protein [Chloroflexaceae bacterium]MDW8389266.1 hypothetical protein [Oscillochloridaceae bacterium]